MSGIRSWALAVAAGLLAALAGCASTPDSDLAGARAEALLVAPAVAGRIPDLERESVAWEGNGELLLTPTALFMSVPGGYRAISYATVTSVAVRAVREWMPIGKDRMWTDVLVVETSRPTCGRACVFRFNEPAMATRFAQLIDAQRPGVDRFGRRDEGREAWVAAGLRNARFFWSREPAYLERTDPTRRKAVEAWFCMQTGCKAGGTTAAIYGAALRHALPGDPADGYAFRELPGIEVNFRSELSRGALAKALETADPAVARLLVSDLDRIELAEQISADYVVSIEATFRAYVDYFHLQPLQDGHYFYARHAVTRPLDEWLSMDDAAFAAEVGALAQQVARRVREDLAPQQFNTQQDPGNSSGTGSSTAQAVQGRTR